MFKRLRYVTFCCILPFGLLLEDGCDNKPTADQVQAARQEKVQAEIAAQTGMPALKNGREAKLVKMIYEMRDQNISTFTYVHSEMTGKFRFLGNTIGYGVPYSTQYSAPTRMVWMGSNHGYHSVPQSEPNGLFPPSSAEGTWVLMKDPNGEQVLPLYIESRITVSQFRLPDHIVARD